MKQFNIDRQHLFNKTWFIKRSLAFSLTFFYLQACSNSSSTTVQLAKRNAHASKPASPTKLTQRSVTIPMKQAKVELDIYSGRVNPSWLLSEPETTTLRSLLSQLQPSKPVNIEGKLGYRGFDVNLRDLKSQQLVIYKIFKGHIWFQTDNSTRFYLDTDRQIERWLLKSGKSHLPLPADLEALDR